MPDYAGAFISQNMTPLLTDLLVFKSSYMSCWINQLPMPKRHRPLEEYTCAWQDDCHPFVHIRAAYMQWGLNEQSTVVN